MTGVKTNTDNAMRDEQVVAVYLASEFNNHADQRNYISQLFQRYENLEFVEVDGIKYMEKELLIAEDARLSTIIDQLQAADILPEERSSLMQERQELLGTVGLDGNIPVGQEKQAFDARIAEFHAERDELRERAETLTQALNDQQIHALCMDADKAANAGVRLSSTGAARDDAGAAQAKKSEEDRKSAIERQLILATQRLNDFEGGLEAQYGVNFDLDLLGDLVEDGHFTDEEYARFASIEDKDERRKAIAKAIQDKIDAGEIDPADLKDHPWASRWLDLHEEVVQARDAKAEFIVANKAIPPEANNSAVLQAASISDDNNLSEGLRDSEADTRLKTASAETGFTFSIPT